MPDASLPREFSTRHGGTRPVSALKSKSMGCSMMKTIPRLSEKSEGIWKPHNIRDGGSEERASVAAILHGGFTARHLDVVPAALNVVGTWYWTYLYEANSAFLSSFGNDVFILVFLSTSTCSRSLAASPMLIVANKQG